MERFVIVPAGERNVFYGRSATMAHAPATPDFPWVSEAKKDKKP